MKMENACSKCSRYDAQYYCDTCSAIHITTNSSVPISVIFGCGSSLNGEEYHFCNYKCLLNFINSEIKKED